MKILVVEDNHATAALIQDTLSLQSHDIQLAHTAGAGLRMVETNSYELIILDLALPDLDGLEVCRQLRAMGVKSSILMLTGRGGVTEKIKGLDVGADDYLTKPFHVEELRARVRVFQRQFLPVLKNVLQLGALRYDLAGPAAYHGDQKLELTPRQLRLFEFLMRHPNQLLSKEKLVSYVWPDDRLPLENSVVAMIKQLRHKIDRPFGTEYLQTVHGMGYRLSDKR
jgi:two-component system, OmpR family, response regulator